MTIEIVSVICGVVLVAVGCGLLNSIKLRDNEVRFTGDGGSPAQDQPRSASSNKGRWIWIALFAPRLLVVLLGFLMVIPYIGSAWQASSMGRLFAMQVHAQVTSLLVNLDPKATNLAGLSTSIIHPTPDARHYDIVIEAQLPDQFDSIAAMLNAVPRDIATVRHAVYAEAAPERRGGFRITIRVWPDTSGSATAGPETAAAAKAQQGSIGIVCIATSK